MNNKKVFLLAVVASLVILSAFLITVTADTGDEDYAYVIQPHEDTFAIYKNKSASPLFVFEDQRLIDLPKIDQDRIREGLLIKDDDELQQRIEDFEG